MQGNCCLNFRSVVSKDIEEKLEKKLYLQTCVHTKMLFAPFITAKIDHNVTNTLLSVNFNH